MKLYNLMKAHKITTAIICVLIFFLQALAVHALHKWDIGIPWFTKTWEAGDVLAYVSGFEAFLGTVFLGFVSLDQSKKADEANRRLSEENNYLQKVMSQKLMPVVQLSDLKSTSSKIAVNATDLPSARTFLHFTRYSSDDPQNPIQIIHVNIDVENGPPAYKKQLSFSVQNVSEAVLRHFCIDGITIRGYKDTFPPIICANQRSGNGVSSLFGTGKMFKMQITLFYNNEKIRSMWDCDIGGIGIILHSTNTTITGIQFHEFMSLSVSDAGHSHVSYGEKPFDMEDKNDA